MNSKILNTLICGCLGATLIFFQSCDVEVGPAPLVADAGEDFTAAPLTTVELDGTGSTPAAEIQFEWEFTSGPVDETKISLTNQNTATAKFIPPKNGVYYFTLEITRNSQFTTDHVTVTVDGVITLTTSAQNLTLTDIESDPAKPDYRINDILTLSNSSRMLVDGSGTNGIVIECSESAGVAITEGSHTIVGVKFTSPSGWKGIMISGGSSTLTNLTVEKGGKGLFETATETAALTVKGGSINMTNTIFNGTTGYDLLVLNNSGHTINNNQFKSIKPVKAPVSLVSTLNLNNFSETYDYITLTTPGASTYVTSVDGQTLRFGNSRKFYIDGDLSISSHLTIEQGAMILMKENAGIVAGGGSSIQGSSLKSVIQGINSSAWKGIVLAGSSSHLVNGLILRDAGSAVFSTGSITTDVKAAIHVLITASLQNIEVFNSKGYGVSWGANDQPNGIFNSTFTDCAAAAVRVTYPFANLALRENHNNTFTMPANVPAVELYGSGSLPSTTIWRPLNGNNFYLATTNILLSGNLTLLPGVKIKFASGKSISGSSKLIAVGTASAPVVLEGPIDSPGSWSGILLEGLFNIEFCQIRNGGQSLMFGASAPAALVVKYTGTVTADNFTFKNNTVTGSTGLGVLIELSGKDPGIDIPANNNTYSNNTAGNTLKK